MARGAVLPEVQFSVARREAGWHGVDGLMSKGASKDYKQGRKNNWRRAMWNEVLRRTDGSERTSPILYLCGRQDMDRDIAISKGVPDQNLIAIDLCMDNAESVRRSGRPSIAADVIDVLAAWPRHRRVAAVLLDFCHGFEDRLIRGGGYGTDLPTILCRAPFHESVVMINFQRGRDASTNDLRDLYIDNDDPSIPSTFPKGFLVSTMLKHPNVKLASQDADSVLNRAAHWLIWQWALTLGNTEDLKRRYPKVDIFTLIGERAVGVMMPWLFSYRSESVTRGRKSSVVFDSIVYRPITVKDLRTPDFGVEFDEDALDQLIGRDEELARRVSAMLAVRTMRIEGTL